MTYSQIVIKNIKLSLDESGVKHKVVAERAGLTPQAFSDILNGRKIITAEHIPVLAKALNVNVNDLYSVGMRGGD